MESQVFHADKLWLQGQWQSRVRIEVDADGRVQRLASDAPRAEAESMGEWVLPGMSNLHSHAFQRAMAGMAERSARADDSFWTWRETMYAFAGRVDPEDLQAIAAQLFVEMLKAGYTRVCEFHYLHHQADGTRYDDPAAMSRALISAARETGIGLTLLPTMYVSGGFDGRDLAPRQRRFRLDNEAWQELVGLLAGEQDARIRLGLALHSLRAVPAPEMQAVLASDAASAGPIHIHVSEQVAEVQDCLAVRNATPIRWLLDHAPVDRRWCLVHATHGSREELAEVAANGAVVGLCPTTEANLGDGVFPLADFLHAGGAIGIGSDSNVSVSMREELRWLEYGQRLNQQRRNVGASVGASVGETLLAASLAGGTRAAGQPPPLAGTESVDDNDASADLLVLDADAPALAGATTADAVDRFVFAGNQRMIRHVMVGGRWRVRDFHHADEERILARYRAALQRLQAG